ncbi:ABC transporter permease subunit [Microbacterium sp. W1N]|uniref:ABC transporter permease n=1 Tax=Microbacterium festucae TaxID=2977531 RepID=UPI0021BFD64C|nr:ABC transporter permease subunit [Microbacterium festucae]MCT9820498.1 ABC transporter permease subunit [Microbacterium festucae]
MLVRSRMGRLVVHSILAVIAVMVFALPFAILVMGAFSTSWSGVVPSGITLGNFQAVFTESATVGAIIASVISAGVSTLIALVVATVAALSTRSAPRMRRVVDTLFLLPVAVPSVAVGLAVLMAFSAPPFTVNGTVVIVLIAHTVLVLALAYQPISAAVTRLEPSFEEAAAALGAGRLRVLRTVTLPALRPALAGAAALCIAMSMGELTATMMVAPPTWRTMPLQIFSFTSRGIRLYEGAALAVVLMLITLVCLLVLQRATLTRRHR